MKPLVVCEVTPTPWTTVHGKTRKHALAYMPKKMTPDQARDWCVGFGISIALRRPGSDTPSVRFNHEGRATYLGPL